VRVRFHAACYAEWRAEREAAARQALGLEGSFRSERPRRCPCGPVPIRRRWSCIRTRGMRCRRELRRHALDDDCHREARRPRGQPRAFEEGLTDLNLDVNVPAA